MDVYAGLRYVYIKARVSPKGVGIQGQSASRDWVDPIIGSIYRHDVNDDWSMLYMADYGGFGIGSASDRTYQLAALAEFNGGGPWSFGLGYRYLMIDHSSGSNPTKDETHLRFSGPIVGAAYRF